jgi:hypothetical protein
MTLALVFAMGGGAYAASKVFITSTKQISPKVLKALKGNTGPAGPQGSAGPAGPQGPQGLEGKAGGAAKDGASGTNGTNGVSVTSATLAAGNAHCSEGGSEFNAAESKKTYACNGSPWTAGGTLPVGKTETGEWVLRGMAAATEEFETTAISFPIPLASPPPNFIFVEAGLATPEHCTGDALKPGAASGYLCIFESEATGFLEVVHRGGLLFQLATSPEGTTNAGTTGGELLFTTTKTGAVSDEGSWAVTAPSPT